MLMFSLLASRSTAQISVISSQKCKWVKVLDESVVLDTLSIDPASFSSPTAADSLFQIDYDINSGQFKVQVSTPADSIFICYRVFPFRFYDTRFKRNLTVYDSNAYFRDNRLSSNYLREQREQLFETDDLQKSGSITRGISVGNTQNVFVNSALNLQLDGKLSDDIFIRASISDQNIPLQPEGNTQQLHEFDKVFIQLYNQNASLTAGDVVLKHDQSYFLKYYKNVQGGQLAVRYKPGEKSTANTSISASVAKGKFASMQVEPIEGVAGPYRLRGPNNERFIIVLANSEKIFLDGVLLQRGFDDDYVIDYNLGEVTFTSNILITQYSRIRADFEYADRNYSRSNLSANHQQTLGKFDIYFNAYAEKDNPNRPLSFDLSLTDQQYLSEIGDDISLARINSYDSVRYSADRILYQRVDTTYDGGQQAIFSYSNDPDMASFEVYFTDVGAGNGNYQQKRSNVNGRIYEWVAPVNGVSQGRFEPVRTVPLPQKKQMVNLGTAFNISKHDKVFIEAAISDYDLNLYSRDDAANDQGKAIKAGYQMLQKPVTFLGKYKMNAGLAYEYNHKDFTSIDRFRSVEFDRDWSLNPEDSSAYADDHIFNIGMGVEKDSKNHLNYNWVRRKRGDTVNGVQQTLKGAQQFGKVQLQGSAFLLNNKQESTSSDWTRIHGDVAYHTKFIVPGYAYVSDKNSISNAATGAVLGSAMFFEEHRMYIKSSDSLETRYEISHSIRDDQLPLEGEFMQNTHAQTTRFLVQSKIGKSQRIGLTSTFRQVKNYLTTTERNESAVMGRVDYQADFLKRIVKSELSYAITNGRELKREFIYLMVPTGEGTHTWVDENNDGVQDLDEFYEAINFDEKNYARIFVPTDEYILAYTQNFSYRIVAGMPASWRNAGSIKGFLARFSNNTFLNVDRKITDQDLSARLLPFNAGINQEDILSVRENLRTTFFYNRSDPKYGFDGALWVSNQKQLLTGGFEAQGLKEYRLNSRLNIQRIYNFNLHTIKSVRSHGSDFLLRRNYSIATYKIAPELGWQPKDNIRFTGSYAYSAKENQYVRESVESAQFNEFSVDFRYTKVSKSTFNAGVKFIDIEFTGEENSPLGYVMLEALRPGKNFTWSLNLQQKLSAGLQLTLNYEGRKSPGNEMIQIGRMQLSALF